MSNWKIFQNDETYNKVFSAYQNVQYHNICHGFLVAIITEELISKFKDLFSDL